MEQEDGNFVLEERGVNWRGKGIWERLRQMIIGKIPNKSMKTVEQRGKG